MDTHRAVTSAADVRIAAQGALTSAAPSAGAEAASVSVRPTGAGIGWIISKLKSLGGVIWKKLTEAVRGGFEAFKKAYEEYVPWLVRKAIEVGASVYQIYSAIRDFIGL
ncbi:hypothetical protein DKG71_33430 [Streptomyces sp. NEAU-S7GS2]|nr:hypothetical protein DKG71_33430 [Streptomyces sp. NEAU-S7GS2]